MALTIFFLLRSMRAALWCFSCFLRREAASRAGAGLLLCSAYFFEFGEPEPGRGASRFDCDSVWRVETLLRLVKPAMPVIWPAWILCSLLHRSFSVQSQVCLGTRRMSSDARRIILRGSARPRAKAALTKLSPSAPAGLDTVGWKAFATLSESTELGRRSRIASPSISPADIGCALDNRDSRSRRGAAAQPGTAQQEHQNRESAAADRERTKRPLLRKP